ncbi:arginine ABC transporter permease [Lachnoclostridium sp. An14]|uniref:amino acid ABC transporter permease n=1 Tax=Lachnoclostridium sp. An14 TaxID=1965562 RepID=UPI000B3AE511|nr:amino acid ABC transporter permease [Lachnoclostridium sp. An14]OUQ21055.1 arginine ABC transporter permease [Lachnoclostridium sp. An14]
MLETIIKILNKYGFVYVQGLAGTLCLAGITIVAGTALGTALALMRMTKIRPLELFVKGYIWILRGTPILLQLYFFWILLPKVVPFKISDVASIIIALIVNSGAYVAEIIRAGIQAVDSGQMEAARSLGLTGTQAMRKVVLPQAVRNILPALGNEFVNMIKQVSLASVFFINELTTSYKTVQAATYIPIEPIIIAGLIYLLVTTVLSQAVGVMEYKIRLSEG